MQLIEQKQKCIKAIVRINDTEVYHKCMVHSSPFFHDDVPVDCSLCKLSDREVMPSLISCVWSFAKSMALFLATGIKLTTQVEYESRLKICDTCNERTKWRCRICGCFIPLKAAGVVWQCNKWPVLTIEKLGVK